MSVVVYLQRGFIKCECDDWHSYEVIPFILDIPTEPINIGSFRKSPLKEKHSIYQVDRVKDVLKEKHYEELK